MTALSPTLPDRLQDTAHVHTVSAYNICLQLERSLQQAADNGESVGNSNDIMHIRILGYLIHFVPTDVRLSVLVSEILAAGSDRALLDVGKMYFDHFIRAFRANRGRIPTPSNDASHPSLDTVADMLNNRLEDAPQSHPTPKKNALYRDGYRCVVTEKYDTNSILSVKELKQRAKADPKSKVATTQCAHIFADSTSQDIALGSHNREHASETLWDVMLRFGYTGLPEELNGSNIHRLENVMTVEPSFGMTFDDLKVWFITTNKYKLEAVDDILLNNYPEYITFTTPDPHEYPVPSAVYLAIHAACAKVAHFSGAGAYIDKLYREMEDGMTLDAGGASAAMLELAVFELQAAGQ